MSYLLRNDDLFTVRVSWTASRTYLCEVHHALDVVCRHESETAKECLDVAARFVDHHVSSRYLWALNADSTAPPRIREKLAAYTETCRHKVEALYGGRP